jgi:hypothetical protein
MLIFLGACASVQFANREILWHDPDDRASAMPPKRRDAGIKWEGMRDTFFRPAARFFAVDYLGEAQNVNALDEVPDSTWFVNRRRDPASPDDQPLWTHYLPEVVERGAVPDDGPILPLTVLKEKSDGSSNGLVVMDARGVKYALKFDPPGYPGLTTSVEVVATRLAWAAGWYTPADTLVDFKREDLILSPEAWTADRYDHHRPLSQSTLDDLIEYVGREGTVRAVASRWIEGETLGWFSYLGRDKHDPNDRVDHEKRRDLRGFGVWAAWVDDVDTFENNTLDSYVGAPGQGHVVHYQQGVGASFGRFFAKPIDYWMGQTPYFSPGSVLLSVATLGILPRPWSDEPLQKAHAEAAIEWPELGFFDAEHFDPKRWRPVADNPAFVRQTDRDRYWGAKQVVAFNEGEVRAAVAAGRFEPVVAEHLFDVLWKRRERIARAFFAEVSPLDHFRVDGSRLCFEDLWLTAGLGGAASYSAREGRAPLPLQNGCVILPHRDGYRVIELHKTGQKHSVRVHVMGAHILGLQR